MYYLKTSEISLSFKLNYGGKMCNDVGGESILLKTFGICSSGKHKYGP